VTIAAEPVVFPLHAVIYRPAVQIYPTRGTFNIVLAALFKVWDARLI
jgi:hypothetical protein